MANTTDFKVTRYEWYPAEEPTGICVGFISNLLT